MLNPYTKAIDEMNYLHTQNTSRYRPILRFFYEQHGRRTQLKAEDIFEHLQQFQDFEDYTIAELRQDLTVLESLGNITSRQETNDYYTIEEVKAKRFKYQATHYTIQIERFLESLETSQADFGGGSLDKNLFDRIADALESLYSIRVDTPPEEVFRRWEDVMEYFRRLDRKSSDYLAHISSFQAEDEMMTEAFLVRRQELITYLRDFVRVLQVKLSPIQHLLEHKFNDEWVGEIIDRVIAYQISIFRFGDRLSPEATKKRLNEEWGLLTLWFQGEESEASNIMKQTGEIIRKMLWFSARLIESKSTLRSRKQEFLDLAKHFSRMESDIEAHRLASVVIGVPYTRHLSCDEYDTSGRIESFWDMGNDPIPLGSRRPGARTKGKTSAIADNAKKKKELLEAFFKEQEALKQDFQRLIQNGKIELDSLPEITRAQRQKLLQLLDRCMLAGDRSARTEWGHIFIWSPKTGRTRVRCADGELDMPNGEFILQQRSRGVAE
ncbi:TIGR02677 family protein [Paenibacillus allorhizosphaerae]|uniref:TIGR02677 family protein n=1 Tax=Paenibacillus allorhizosphaerae TaxID=2849866 RepID=A0ABM8VNN0_9BACL|nr:TIGR02677 family protein [Paenibacillus allorhizosphaerae]CAG7651662.1 hypothetical protein PAECIP111802_05020 [Paenibacillus allorhizosphaerae]